MRATVAVDVTVKDGLSNVGDEVGAERVPVAIGVAVALFVGAGSLAVGVGVADAVPETAKVGVVDAVTERVRVTVIVGVPVSGDDVAFAVEVEVAEALATATDDVGVGVGLDVARGVRLPSGVAVSLRGLIVGGDAGR